jgi:hypothetical protein
LFLRCDGLLVLSASAAELCEDWEEEEAVADDDAPPDDEVVVVAAWTGRNGLGFLVSRTEAASAARMIVGILIVICDRSGAFEKRRRPGAGLAAPTTI